MGEPYLAGVLRISHGRKRADQRTITDPVRLETALNQIVESCLGLLRPQPLVACRDQGVVGDDVGLQAARGHLLEELDGSLGGSDLGRQGSTCISRLMDAKRRLMDAFAGARCDLACEAGKHTREEIWGSRPRPTFIDEE
jgi:hypothetical protein